MKEKKKDRLSTPYIGSYSFSNDAIIAETFDDEATIRKVKISELEREGIKMLGQERITLKEENEYQKQIVFSALNYLLKPGKWNPPYDNSFPIDTHTAHFICDKVIDTLKGGKALINLRPPAKIFGSIHGQYGDLIRFFQSFGYPVDFNQQIFDLEGFDYVFLGNYVDRGKFSLEVVFLLFCLKIQYPHQVHLLRGSHEDIKVNSEYGLAEECRLRLKEDINSPKSIFKKMNKVFEYLPLAATIADKIFCVHSGIGDSLTTLKEISSISLPCKINYNPKTLKDKIIIDLLWSDPVLNETEKESLVIFLF